MGDLNDPMTPLTESAHSLHELYLAWVTAGFTEAQAMQMVMSCMAEAFKAGLAGGTDAAASS